MEQIYGPDGQPAHFDGASWVSSDGRFWWNGTVWQRHVARRSFRINGFVVFMLLACAGAGSYLAYQYTHQPPPVAQGVFNTDIVSRNTITYDYQRATSCKDVTFDFDFFDDKGVRVQDMQGSAHHSIVAMQVYHVSVAVFPDLSPSVVRFTAIDTCHG